MPIKVYYIPGSHPCNAVFKALEMKGLDYKKVVVIPPGHRLQMKLMFGSRHGAGDQVHRLGRQTSRRCRRRARSSECSTRSCPSRCCFRPLRLERDRVIAAESWADGNFQDVGRRLIWAHLFARPRRCSSYSAGDAVPLPQFVQDAAAKPVSLIEARLNKAADDERVRRDLAELPAMLDQVDGYIADGVIGGETPNAADLQIAASLNLWMSMADICARLIEPRPCGRLTRKIFPEGSTHGHIDGGVLPAEWLEPLRAGSTAPA